MKFDLILAVDEKNWLWKNNDLAWKIPKDVKYFKDITTKTEDLWKMNAVVMWRSTRESIPSKYRPLSDRINCILTKKILSNDSFASIDSFVLYFNSLDLCFDELERRENIEKAFVIWWASLYNQILKDDRLDKIYLTKVKWDFGCEVFFDWIPEHFEVESYTEYEKENGYEFSFRVYKNKNT